MGWTAPCYRRLFGKMHTAYGSRSDGLRRAVVGAGAHFKEENENEKKAF